MKAEIINQPYSGEFEERIYDVESVWNSQSWTWVKFTDENGIEKVGQFRGFPKEVKVSKQKSEIVVLTSDCVFRLNTTELNVIEAENQVDYGNLEVSPNGTFIFSEFSDIYKLEKSLADMQIIKSPFEMDMIEFKKWNGDILEFECDEMGRWERHEIMELDTSEWTIRIKKTHHNNV
ncbi:hypothetical protein [Ulvibacter litoralis]|uniref:Uncharacterized protein n=1 Tax=Ulvibacter litoralis TaxID=227084 RepID=A0A1G7JKQ5_9FLAO|nr:hypothetical protein [Ulvibacter litoralis]GHC65405.1 hypothetical protein GCM10008083_33280 [Ulvibacter litoralis]SDF25473.1 hypothetical protein SAMN05421855_1172 [Ulvibacter litoralis]